MSASIFEHKLVPPDDRMLSGELGDSYKFLEVIMEKIKNDYGNFSQEWKFYGQKSVWILKLFTKKRNVLFVIPLHNSFICAFTLGAKAEENIYVSSLPEEIKKQLFEAPKYAEGKTIRIDVNSTSDLNTVLLVMDIKIDS